MLDKNLESPLNSKDIQKDISPDYPLEGLMLKLILQYFGTWCKELTHLKRPWCWERLKVGGEGDDRGWDGWVASLTQRTWIWIDSWSWWWTRRPGVLWSMGSQRVGHDWASELNRTGITNAQFSYFSLCIFIIIKKESSWCLKASVFKSLFLQ